MSGPLCTVSAEPSWTIELVMEAIQRNAGIAAESQRLLMGTEELARSQCVHELVLSDNRVEVMLVRRTPEQMAWLRALQIDGLRLQQAPSAIRSDYEAVHAAVAQNGRALFYADASLRDNHDIVVTATLRDGRALACASASLRRDRDFISGLVRINGELLAYVSQELKVDRDLTLAAVTQCGQALRFAHPIFASDPEVVIAACRQNGDALVHAAWELQANPKLIRAAEEQQESHYRKIRRGVFCPGSPHRILDFPPEDGP